MAVLVTAFAVGAGLTVATAAVTDEITAAVTADHVTADPAPAEVVKTNRAYDIVSVTGQDLKVHAQRCRNVRFTVRYRNPRDSDHGFTADMQVWKGRSYQDRALVYVRKGTSADRVLSATKNYYWCPDQGLGGLRLGPSKVTGKSYTGATASASFNDDTVGHLSVRADSRTTLRIDPLASAPGRARFTAAVRRYSLSTGRYQLWPIGHGRRVRLERRDGDGWTRVALVRTDRRGTARSTLAAPVGARFRARIVGTRYFWPSSSPVRVVPRR